MGIKHIHVKQYQNDEFMNFAVHKKKSVLSLTTQLYLNTINSSESF